jgi:hypothetical protein
MKKNLLLKSCGLIFLFLFLVMSADAQKLKFVRKPLLFPSGSNSVTLTGMVTDKVRPLYSFRARKDQTITVHIISKDDNAYFNVFDKAQRHGNGVDGDFISNPWSYTFTEADNYELVVFINKGSSKYTLEVKLN